MLEFRILGPVEVVRDGVRVELVGQRQRGVLGLLLLNANHVVPTDVLVDALWGAEAPPTAAASLHNTISQLRKLVGADVVETRAPGYVLHVDADAVDATRFERRIREARAAAEPARSRILHEALGEWRGPPFAELRYEGWAQAEARRLEELRVAALEDRFEADLDGGRHTELVPEIEAAVLEHPHRERLRAHLMLALYRSGRQADALEAYRDARRTLSDDLGLEPGPRLRELHGAILRQDGALEHRGGARSGPPRGGPPPDHLTTVANALLAGRVVPVLAVDDTLAPQIALRFRYPPGEAVEVARVTQYAAATHGYGPLYDELHALAHVDGQSTGVHRFFASLPPLLRDAGAPHQLIVTTEYGSGLEDAFADAGEEVDVVSYIASGRDRGRFRHLAPDGSARVIDVPNTYAEELSLERRTVVLKVRGHADASRESESFVVTEDDYIEYLGRADVANGVPVGLAATLRHSHFLFLGYPVRDWSLRLVLGRMWGDAPAQYRSWAVQPVPRPPERELWQRLHVDLVEVPLERYVAALAGTLGVDVGSVA